MSEEEYVPRSTIPRSQQPPKYIPATKQGPKPLTLDDYRRRIAQRKEEKLTAIPRVDTKIAKKKRGGRLVKLRRRLADLLSIVRNEENPVPWTKSQELWEEIDKIKNSIKNKNN